MNATRFPIERVDEDSNEDGVLTCSMPTCGFAIFPQRTYTENMRQMCGYRFKLFLE